MPMSTGNGENPQFYGQWTVQDSQNGLWAKSLRRQRILSAWIPGLLTLKIQGSLPPYKFVKIFGWRAQALNCLIYSALEDNMQPHLSVDLLDMLEFIITPST